MEKNKRKEEKDLWFVVVCVGSSSVSSLCCDVMIRLIGLNLLISCVQYTFESHLILMKDGLFGLPKSFMYFIFNLKQTVPLTLRHI